jgi:hypothetical protein
MSADAWGLDERRRHQGGAEWLVDGARSAAHLQQVMAQLYDRLLCCGIPLWRAAVSVSDLASADRRPAIYLAARGRRSKSRKAASGYSTHRTFATVRSCT